MEALGKGGAFGCWFAVVRWPMNPSQRFQTFSELAVLSASVCACALFLGKLIPQAVGWDFPQYFLAVRLPLWTRHNYDEFLRNAHALLAPVGVAYVPPYVRPAVFSLPLWTIMWLPYWTAFRLWAGIQGVAYVLTVWLLKRRLIFIPPLLVGMGIFIPATHGIVNGQDATSMALLCVIGFLLLERGRGTLAGLVFGLCLYKYNLFALLPLFLILRKERRALWSFLVTGMVIAAVSLFLFAPREYLHLLSRIPDLTIGFGPRNIVGLRGVAATVQMPALYWTSAAVVAVATIYAIPRLPFDRAYCATLLGSLLCAYHVTWYDYSIAIFPLLFLLSSPGWTGRAVSFVMLFYPAIWFGNRIIVMCSFILLAWVILIWPVAVEVASKLTRPAPSAAETANSALSPQCAGL